MYDRFLLWYQSWLWEISTTDHRGECFIEQFLTECRNEIASVLHYFSVWSVQNLELLCRPIRCKTNANHDLVVRVFPRFGKFGCFFFELSLAQFSFLLIGRWYYFVFGFTSHNRKALWEIFWCLVRLVRVSATSLLKFVLDKVLFWSFAYLSLIFFPFFRFYGLRCSAVIILCSSSRLIGNRWLPKIWFAARTYPRALWKVIDQRDQTTVSQLRRR